MLLAPDANVLVAELLRQRGRALIHDRRLDLRLSERAEEETRYELARRVERIVARGHMDALEADALLQSALATIDGFLTVIPHFVYADNLDRAAYRVPRDLDDAPTVALALALGGDEGRCGIWTNDGDFLGCGVPTWTTETLLAHLRYMREKG
jgi:hypothetical protein